ncbi:MAG: efflux RND transporter permease subunit [Flavobacteriales bacterium]|nr:efflux RND transporter permease subunit [Flavobacteriales bacterium]
MWITRYAVKNSPFTLVIFLMIVVVGMNTLVSMPRAEDPEMNAPIYPIVAVYPGTSPEDMENLVVDPIEKRVTELDDIKRVYSTIKDGVAVIRVDALYGVDVDRKHQELVQEINALRAELPADIHSIDVQKATPSSVNVLQVALVSENAPRRVLKEQAERLQEELEAVPMLKKVEVNGIPYATVRIDLQLEKLARLNIPLDQVIGAVQSEMANIPGGSVDAGSKTLNVKTSGSYLDAADIARTVVATADGRNTLLRDVARVTDTYQEDRHITRLNGHRSVVVNAAMKSDMNISEAQARYAPILTRFKAQLPQNVALEEHFDQAQAVNYRLGVLGRDFLIAIGLVLLTLLPLGNRASLVVMISIPLSLAMGVVMLNAMGFSLNQLSIVGMVVALGLLVDDSIVVVENIERWLREGKKPLDAVLGAVKEIGVAVIGCTVTLCIAFMPLALMPEASGEFIRSLPLAVILAVVSSMFVSLTIVPFLSIRLLKPHHDAEGNFFLRGLKRGIHATYAPLLERSLHNPRTTLLVALAIFIGSLGLMKAIGFSLFPASEKPQFMVNVVAPLQSNLARTDSLARLVEHELAQRPEVQYYTTNVGKGNPQVYYNVQPENERTDFAQVFVQLQPKTGTRTKLRVIDELRNTFAQVPGAQIEVKDFEQGPPQLAPVEVRIFGEDLDTLRRISAQVAAMLKEMPGSLYVEDPMANLKSDLRVRIDRDKASMLGIATVDIDRTVRLAVAGLGMGTFNDPQGVEREVVITVPKGQRADLHVFDDLYVTSRSGASIPLRQVADLQLEASPQTIKHLGKRRYVSVSSFVQQGFLVDDALNATIKAMDAMRLPAGYTYTMGGEIETRQDSFGGFGTIILATIFLFIAVLVLEFGTFKSTLIVLSVIPLGIVGAVIALWMTGNSLSFVAIVGLIALAGIEVKNTILLVDFTNQLRSEGRTLEEAIREAGEMRFLPIVLTSLTAIGGLLPIAYSTNPLISPLAIVLIGGLISSTVLSRLVTPVVYKLIPPRV